MFEFIHFMSCSVVNVNVNIALCPLLFHYLITLYIKSTYRKQPPQFFSAKTWKHTLAGYLGVNLLCSLLPLQVPGSMVDMNVLLACQLLLEQVLTEGNSPLLQQLYNHLLFDFRIWTRSHFAVCLGEQHAVFVFVAFCDCLVCRVCLRPVPYV